MYTVAEAFVAALTPVGYYHTDMLDEVPLVAALTTYRSVPVASG